MINDKEFFIDFNKAIKQSTEKAEEVVRASALGIFAAIVKDTPVDEGTLKNNWYVTLGSPSNETNNSKDKSGSKTINKGKSALDGFAVDKTKDIYFTNNLPYAERVEFDAWSKQKAPAGMVRINVKAFNDLIEKEARKK